MTPNRKLAALGGKPAFDETLHVGRPNIGDQPAFLRKAAEILERRWLTNNGPLVQELEVRLSALLDVPHCVVMCNGTVALEIAVRAAGITGEVIIPSYTFVGTAHALQWQEITPVFCDVDLRTHSLDVNRIEALLTPRTTAILGVHLWGQPCDVDGLQTLADRHGLKLVFDAAHAFASSFRGRPIGGFGNVEVFSFHATKFFNSFEGGAVTTHDADLADRVRLMRNFGFVGLDAVSHVGTNGKMPEICAAMGLVGLDSLDEFLAVNRRNMAAYRAGLADIPGLTLMEPLATGTNEQYIVVEVEVSAAGLTRDLLVDVLWAENVHARRYFTPGAHRMEPYRSFFPNAGLLLPVTEALCETVMVLPTGTGVSLTDIALVCEILRQAVSLSGEIRSRLAGELAS